MNDEMDEKSPDDGSFATCEEMCAMLDFLQQDGSIPAKCAAAMYFRKLFAQNQMQHSKTVKDFITMDDKMAIALVSCAARWELPELQYDAIWALTNVTAGGIQETHQVVAAGGISVLSDILRKGDRWIRWQALWCLNNIASDCRECRQKILETEFVALAMGMLEEAAKFCLDSNYGPLELKRLRTVVWVFSNLTRSTPRPTIAEFVKGLPILAQILRDSKLDQIREDVEFLADACWCLSYLAEGPAQLLDMMIESGVVPKLVQFLTPPPLLNSQTKEAPDRTVWTKTAAALRTVGNILTGDDAQTQALIDAGVVPGLERLLFSDCNEVLRKETCWAMSNIAAGSEDQVTSLIAREPILMGLFKYASQVDPNQESTLKIQREATWTLCNATTGASNDECLTLVTVWNILDSLCCALEVQSDTNLIGGILETMAHSLRLVREMKGDEFPYCAIIEAAGGMEIIERLKDSGDAETLLKQQAEDLWKTHFGPFLEYHEAMGFDVEEYFFDRRYD